MKGTRHNGRSGKDGVYNPLHNDRRFDPEHSEHIDNERVRQNIYWDCYQGYTTMADRGKEDNFSFNQIEMAWIWQTEKLDQGRSRRRGWQRTG